MRVRYLKSEAGLRDGRVYCIPAGTETDLDSGAARARIVAGIAEELEDPKPKAKARKSSTRSKKRKAAK
jgi:hypothetical protein